MKKVFVSGCYDMLHSGHVAFFEEASALGDLYVGLGSDRTVLELKGRRTVNTERERLYMVKALRMVKDAWINSGSGVMDFEQDVIAQKPDIFFVNEDGYTADKRDFCIRHGIDLQVSRRIPHPGLPVRSTTALRTECHIPFRLDLAGGWLDQPYVSKHTGGPVITISIEPDFDFNDRSGMSSSTRAKAIDLWHTDIPDGDKEKLAKTLFCLENPPGSKYISGSQDSIGIVYPGVNRLNYTPGNYWPDSIMSVVDPQTLSWLEQHLWLVNLAPRRSDFDVLSDTHIVKEAALRLAVASSCTWSAILDHDLVGLGQHMRESFDAQISMFPNMVNPTIMAQLASYQHSTLGWKISGAGGGGYLVLVSEHPINAGLQIKITRPR